MVSKPAFPERPEVDERIADLLNHLQAWEGFLASRASASSET